MKTTPEQRMAVVARIVDLVDRGDLSPEALNILGDLDAAERRIAELEAELAEAHTYMANEDVYRSRG